MNTSIRVGLGFDIHKFEKGRKLIIGGVEIPFEKGLAGHSDADVLIHAIIDAILGAMGCCDIGTLFPDTDEKFKNADSSVLLQQIVAEMKSKNYAVVNIDTNIIAQKPKLMPYITNIKKHLSSVLEIDITQIAVKAKTMEGLDAVGHSEGIAAQAVVLLQKTG